MRFRRRCIVLKFAIIIPLLLLIPLMQQYASNAIIENTPRRAERQVKYSNCETIHIGVVCIGDSYNQYFYRMLKSLYYFRNNPIHFHIIVDDVAEKMVSTIFQTWAVPQASVSMYNVSSRKLSSWWISEYRYFPDILSALLKLTIPKLVPTAITSRIIVIDPYTFFTDDIRNMWNVFNDFVNGQAVGFLKYQNINVDVNYSNKTERNRLSSYIILFNIKRLKTKNYTQSLVKVINETLASFYKVNAADLKIMETILSEHRTMVYHTSSYSESPLETTNPHTATTKNSSLKKVNSNSTRSSNHHRKLSHTILNYNASLLETRQYECMKRPDNITLVKPNFDNCSHFHEAEVHRWRTLLFLRTFEYVATSDDVTFVSQLSYSRRSILEDLSTLWEGPISLAVYLSDYELHEFNKFVENSKFLSNRSDIAYHAVFKEGEDHPINVLRNVALRHVVTPYVFLVDIDFLPMVNLYSVLKKYVQVIRSMENKALVVPAFETKKELPTTKDEVLKLLDNEVLMPFHQKGYYKAHGPTNYRKWRSSNEIYEVMWKTNYEPYIVVQRNVTRYDQRFFGYGWNKVSHIMELKAQGYQFLVLPNAFIVHKPHIPSNDRHKFVKSRRQLSLNFRCLQKLKFKFIREIDKKYGNKHLKEVVKP